MIADDPDASEESSKSDDDFHLGANTTLHTVRLAYAGCGWHMAPVVLFFSTFNGVRDAFVSCVFLQDRSLVSFEPRAV